jgi:AraC-like DNA-binding protein
MDVLSHVTGAMRTGQASSLCIECRGDWARTYPAVAGAAFHLVLQGTCLLIRPGHEPLAVSVGDVVLLPHGPEHRLAGSGVDPSTVEADGPAEPFRLEPRTISIGADQAGDVAPSTVLLSGVYPLDRTRCHPLVNDLPEVIRISDHLGQRTRLRAVTDLLSAELGGPGIGTDSVVSGLLDVLLQYILRAWYQENGMSSNWGLALNNPEISAVLCRIHNNPELPWTVESLGAEAGLSRAAFARRFTALVGQPPLGYLTWTRLGTAAQLLRDSEDSLAIVAHKVGYSSEFAFANAFKREFGSAPGFYRREHSSLS